MNYGKAEQEISDRINEKFSELGLSEIFFAAPIPETNKEAQEWEAQLTKCRVAVEHLDSNFSTDSGLGAGRQMETVKFRLSFEAKKMRGEDGLFTMIDFVKKFLFGFQPTDGERMTIAGYGKEQVEPGVWMPYLDFETKTVNVQNFDPEEYGSGLKSVDVAIKSFQFAGEFDGEQFV